MAPPRQTAGAKTAGLTCVRLMERKTWKPLPAVVVLAGAADFLKRGLIERFTEELFGDSTAQVSRFQGPASDAQIRELPLATVLDDLRTPSFFSPARLVVVDDAGAFVGAHAEDLLPFVEKGFGGGHLILCLSGKLDRRTRFARKVSTSGWLVKCPQPYDRPPPWDTRSPAWDSELSRWVVARARARGLQIDMQTAFLLHEQAGTDLAVLDEELEKISTYLATRNVRKITEDAISAVVGDLHENSVFQAVDLLLDGRRVDTLAALDRLFLHGASVGKGPPVREPIAIVLLFAGALVPKLRSLRRGHGLAAEGGGPDEWISAGLVQRPFLTRFQRQLRAMPPARITRIFRKLYEVDRSIKMGSDPARLLELLVIEC